jgi:hypothetical protein
MLKFTGVALVMTACAWVIAAAEKPSQAVGIATSVSSHTGRSSACH